jgi:hypothetical protein
MSRFANALIQTPVGSTRSALNQSLDLRFGGMNGYAPDLAEWVSAQAYTPKNVIAIVIELPKAFQLLSPADCEAWSSAYKALIEQHPQSITGLNSTLEVDVVENAIGGAGQMFEDFVNVTEARTQPTFTWIDKSGMSIGTFWSTFIRTFMMNPDTKFADIMTLAVNKPTDQLADMYSGTILFVEPDKTGLEPVKAYLSTNFWPRSSGEQTAKRDLTQASESVQVDIQFTALTQQSLGVKTFARQILRNINLNNANASNRPSFVNAIDADLLAVGNGYKANVEKLGAQALQQ